MADLGQSASLAEGDVHVIAQHVDGCYAVFTGRPCDCPPPKVFISRDALTKALAMIYRDAPIPVAKACDEYLDRSGALLGWVREGARSA